MGSKRKHAGPQGGKSNSHKRKWQSNATLHGQGIFMTCTRGKERRAGSEFIDVLSEYAAVLYPDLSLQSLPAPRSLRRQAAATADVDDDDMDRLRNGGDEGASSSSASAAAPKLKSPSPSPPPSVTAAATAASKEAGDDIEAELRAELAELKKGSNGSGGSGGSSKGKATTASEESQETTVPALRLFDTNTECVVFVGVHPLLDPFKLCYAYFEDIEKTAEPKSRLISRLSPVAGFSSATVPGLRALAENYIPRFFPAGENGTFKIEPRVRSHNVLNRTEIIDTVASYIPRGEDAYHAELKNPSHWVVVEVIKSQAALGVLREYNRFNRFNVSEFANAVRQKKAEAESNAGGGSRVATASNGSGLMSNSTAEEETAAAQ